MLFNTILYIKNNTLRALWMLCLKGKLTFRLICWIFVSIILFFNLYCCKIKETANTSATSSDFNSYYDTCEESKIPNLPWPIPRASSHYEIRLESLRLNTNNPMKKMCNIDQVIKFALEASGFSEFYYYYIPDGFALLTPLERFNYENGESILGKNRWTLNFVKPSLKLNEIIKLLSFENPGYFRIILFTVTSEDVLQGNTKLASSDQLYDLLGKGVATLPDKIGNISVTRNTKCIAWIYEFEKKKGSDGAIFRDSSIFPALVHLCRAKILNHLSANLCTHG